jgi:hypothetical protein
MLGLELFLGLNSRICRLLGVEFLGLDSTVCRLPGLEFLGLEILGLQDARVGILRVRILRVASC